MPGIDTPIQVDADQLHISPPPLPKGPIAWAAKNLFSSWSSTVITVITALIFGKLALWFLDWAVLRAVWFLPGASIKDTQACRMPGVGACWALISEKYRFILFGLYPYEQQWRPAICIIIFLGLYFTSAFRRFWNWRLAFVWMAGLAATWVLMRGGIFGLTPVSEDMWGGLPVTLSLSTFGIAFSFPLAIMVALGRVSTSNATGRFVCGIYVELIRAVPLISVLFMASVMFPLFLPDGVTVSKLLRAQVAIIVFSAAYLAETIRGGLQAVDRGQGEAADSLGLGYRQKICLVVLPQALRLVLPPIVSLCIAFFKSTSLVIIVGIFDILNAAKRSIAEPAWQGFGTEAYLFVAAIYFAFCFAMSRYGRALERQGKLLKRVENASAQSVRAAPGTSAILSV
jgi:general L-amino acid transport system permease protein